MPAFSARRIASSVFATPEYTPEPGSPPAARTRRSPPLLGLGFVRGKLALFADGPSYARWLMQAFALFGDPAQRLPLRPDGLYLPLVDVRQDRRSYFPR